MHGNKAYSAGAEGEVWGTVLCHASGHGLQGRDVGQGLFEPAPMFREIIAPPLIFNAGLALEEDLTHRDTVYCT